MEEEKAQQDEASQLLREIRDVSRVRHSRASGLGDEHRATAAGWTPQIIKYSLEL